jgi:alpha-L-fucosidase
LYAFLMGWPGKQAVVAPLTTKGAQEVGKIRNVELLGYKGKLKWTQDEGGLKVEMPGEKPSEHAVTLKVALG